MVQLVRSLLSWLAAAASTPAGEARVLSCSDSVITLAAEDAKLQVGDIFVRVDAHNPKLCREDCSILFREILSDEGNGVYKTTPASFSQVFPSETYDHSYNSVPVESVLPFCTSNKGRGDDLVPAHYGLTESNLARRSLFFGFGGGSGSSAAAESAAEVVPDPPVTTDGEDTDLSRGQKHKSDDYYYDDYYYDDYYYSGSGSYDEHHKQDKCSAFFDATKKFIYDVYCVIRNLDCTPYHPGADDDKYRDDDYGKSKSGSKSGSKDWRRRLLEPDEDVSARYVRRNQGRLLVEETAPTPEDTTVDTNTTDTNTTFGDLDSGGISSTTVVMGATSGGSGDSGSSGSSNSKSTSKSYEDDKYKDDDFYDDDYHYPNNGANFWLLLDAACNYVSSLWSIFGGGKDKDKYSKDDRYSCSYEDDYYCDDDYYSRSKDKHVRRRLASTSVLDQIFALNKDDQMQVPSTFQEWLILEGDGSCPFTKCSRVDKADQCFEQQHLVGDACRDSLEEWFAFSPAAQQEEFMRWDMDAACLGQDYCYASNVFGQTQCDEQFYQSLLQACPESDNSVTLSRHAPLVTGDLSEHCPLLSILLYSQMQLKSAEMYDATQENQSMFESTGCSR